jgi:5-methyltetrahydrofolate--homocysteine methyltransferase
MIEKLEELLNNRILVLDGAMGTMIQNHNLTEADFRGTRYADHGCDVKGNNDLLVQTQPKIIEDIHVQYLQAGADIIETNTFNSNAISMADYQMEMLAHELNVAGAQVAKRATARVQAEQPGRQCFVAGALGPTNRTASMSPDVNNPAFRAVTFDDLSQAYYDQVRGLVEGGVDLLMVETIFDTLNAKAAFFAIAQYCEEIHRDIPIMASVTITDLSGRTLSGQLIEAFWNSISHANLLSVGINCALGAKQMRPYIEELSNVAPIYISCYPNAGLPNAFGGFDETPERMGADVAEVRLIIFELLQKV